MLITRFVLAFFGKHKASTKKASTVHKYLLRHLTAVNCFIPGSGFTLREHRLWILLCYIDWQGYTVRSGSRDICTERVISQHKLELRRCTYHWRVVERKWIHTQHALASIIQAQHILFTLVSHLFLSISTIGTQHNTWCLDRSNTFASINHCEESWCGKYLRSYAYLFNNWMVHIDMGRNNKRVT